MASFWDQTSQVPEAFLLLNSLYACGRDSQSLFVPEPKKKIYILLSFMVIVCGAAQCGIMSLCHSYHSKMAFSHMHDIQNNILVELLASVPKDTHAAKASALMSSCDFCYPHFEKNI